MTGEDWLQRTLDAADELALAHAFTPHDMVEASLTKVADGVRRCWRQAFTSLPAADVDSMVEVLVVDRIRKRRREIEVCGIGMA